MSPERLDPGRFGFESDRPTKESDCYALGMVILEVLTGHPPFQNYTGSTVVMKVVNGERPERPDGVEAAWFTDELWEMLKQCWSPEPKVRPTAEAILKHLERASLAWQTLPPTADDFGRTTMTDIDSTLLRLTSNVTISPFTPLQQLHRLEMSSYQFPAQITSILDGTEYKICIQTLQEEDLSWLVEYLDKACFYIILLVSLHSTSVQILGTSDSTSPLFRTCLRELRRICGIYRTLPLPYMVPDSLLDIDPGPISRGFYGDVHRGSLNNSRVRVKRLFVSSEGAGQNLAKAQYLHQYFCPFPNTVITHRTSTKRL